jgi:hypothetical protein
MFKMINLKNIFIMSLVLLAGCSDNTKNNDSQSETGSEDTVGIIGEAIGPTHADSATDTASVDTGSVDTSAADTASVDTGSVDTDGGSSIHGGNPAPVTWTDCNQWPGSHPCDFSLVDQYGDTFTLYDNYDTVMVLDFSTMWCIVCKNIAPLVQPHQDTYGPQGFLWVTVLLEDTVGNDPDETDIQEWATAYGIIDSPVLAGSRADFVDLTGMDGYPITAWPTFVVIDRGMVLTNGLNGWNEDTIMGWVEDAL